VRKKEKNRNRKEKKVGAKVQHVSVLEGGGCHPSFGNRNPRRREDKREGTRVWAKKKEGLYGAILLLPECGRQVDLH